MTETDFFNQEPDIKSITVVEEVDFAKAKEVEQATLGACLMKGNQAVVQITTFLTPEKFYYSAHKLLATVIFHLFDKNEPVDVHTVVNELKLRSRYEESGGISYIDALQKYCANPDEVEIYGKKVEEAYLLRQILQAQKENENDILHFDGGESKDLIDRCTKRVVDISVKTHRSNFTSIADVADDIENEIYQNYLNKRTIVGTKTGFKEIDELTIGLQKSELTIVGAVPGFGKTSLLLSIARNISINQELPVAIFSLEMSKQQLYHRLIANMTGINSQKLKTGYFSAQELELVREASSKLKRAKLYIDDTAAATTLEIKSKCRQLSHRTGGLALIMVDYLGLARTGKESGAGNRTNEIGEIARNFMSLSREMDSHVLCACQLSRAVNARENKRPGMSDLRDSGEIEQHANNVWFIYRPDYYDKKANPDTQQRPGYSQQRQELARAEQNAGVEGTKEKKYTEVIIDKQRNGPTGTAYLEFDKTTATFKNAGEVNYNTYVLKG